MPVDQHDRYLYTYPTHHPIFTLAITLVVAVFAGYIMADNERLSIEVHRLAERAVPIDSTSTKPELDGQPVFVSAHAEPLAEVKDELFELQMDALALERDIQRYLWVPRWTHPLSQAWTRVTDRGRGHLQWTAVEYTAPEDQRPPHSPMIQPAVAGTTAQLGAFQVQSTVMRQIYGLPEVFDDFDESFVDHLNRDLRNTLKRIDGDAIIAGPDPGVDQELGDEKIRLRYLPPDTISVIALQQGDELVSATKHPDFGHVHGLVAQGAKSPQELRDLRLQWEQERQDPKNSSTRAVIWSFLLFMALLGGAALADDYRWAERLPGPAHQSTMLEFFWGLLFGVSLVILGYQLGHYLVGGFLGIEMTWTLSAAIFFVGSLVFGFIVDLGPRDSAPSSSDGDGSPPPLPSTADASPEPPSGGDPDLPDGHW